MKIKTVLFSLSLPLAISISLHAQIISNSVLDSPQVQADILNAHQMLESSKLDLLNSSNTVSASNLPTVPAPEEQQVTTRNQSIWTPAEQAEMRAKGIDPRYATPITAITNKQGYVISSQDVYELKSQGWTDEQIANATPYQAPKQVAELSPTPDELKNAVVCLHSFLGMTNAMLPADVISMKPESLKFRINGQDYNFSGHYAVTLNTPRQHKNPYFGFGTPETAKVLILENWNGDMLPLQNATIWEKSSGFIDATALDKEWIYSGTYTIQN